MKTDNHNLPAKLELRRAMLRDAGPVSVLDCFAGSEAVWSALRQELEVAEYLALDIKSRRKRIKMDSLRFLQNQKWRFDVVDLDAYGSPWEHFDETLKTDRQESMTVFLTIGSAVFGALPRFILRETGIPVETPNGIHKQLGSQVLGWGLSMPLRRGWKIKTAMEGDNPGGTAKYFGMRLEKAWKNPSKS